MAFGITDSTYRYNQNTDIMNLFAHWEHHFKHNTSHFDHLSWTGKAELSEAEQQLIQHSLQQFQRGENSEGKHLIQSARDYSALLGEESYLRTIVHFIKEEQRHALTLGRYMDLHEIPKIKSHWVDDVFRKLRQYTGPEYTIIILLTAELIAAVYYIALHNATNSPLLQQICQQILVDEQQHIRFQAFTLRQLRSGQSSWSKRLSRSFQALLLDATILLVWWQHQAVLSAGGFSFSIFRKMVKQEYRQAIKMIDGDVVARPTFIPSTQFSS